ncbi:alkaline phosphatase family protein [Polymorphospora rubra]|uniref:Nucleotide pyrophosphatase n=1 Tax=Polymorphospora rubra TaxID=338584 RepID=A0A810N0N4_9ACTN|nr:alkaline phosphatase family protein [Polymorphospora rubra]BCJ65779.1 nucleotide pyrophosphatase [Polymorphospora rubra]
MSRLFMLGIDGLPPATLRRFVEEGILPNCAKLFADAACLEVTPTLPALTSPGWQTIASGAHPGTLGISNILLPTLGRAPDHIRNGFDRSLSRGEYLWEVLAAEGEPAIVMKYPGSWPPKVEADHLIQVDGAGGYADITCSFEEVSSTCYSCGFEIPTSQAQGCCSVPHGYDDHWRVDSATASGWTPVVARDPLNWTGLPAGAAPGFETVLTLTPAGQRRRRLLHALAHTRDGQPRLLVSTTKDGGDRITELAVGQWSDWIHDESGRGSYAYRLKLLELDVERRVLRLYRSEGHRTTGFTRPGPVADDLLREVGPVAEWTGTFDFMNGLIDLDTQLEIYDRHTRWVEDALRQLAGRRPWRGAFVHWHVVEYAHHIAGAALDPDHPRHDLDQERYLSFLRDTYRLLDRLVGTVAELVDVDDTLALVSDHGHDTVHSLFFINDFLRERGFLATGPDDTIDWSRTRAYGLFPGLILANTTSRWSGGIVAEEEVEPLRQELTAALRSLVDPRTGRPVVSAVLGPTELRAYGQHGEAAPDLFFAMDKGYEPATRLRHDAPALFELTIPGAELTSGHGSFHPTSASAATLALIRNPELRGGSVGRYPVAMVDLAPTFAALMGVRPPQGCDGRPLDFHACGLTIKESAE